MQLPIAIRQALEEIIQESESTALGRAAGDVSARYRRDDRGADASLQIRDRTEAHAYLATRLPATFCAATRVLQWVQDVVPSLNPRSVLDVGAGPATATLAAMTQWPAVEQCTLVEPNAYLRAAGTALLEKACPGLKASWRPDRFGAAHPQSLPLSDVVVSGYMLNELAESDGEAGLDFALDRLWAATQQVLVIVEPGTPLGFSMVARARQRLLTLGGHLVAPCPHVHACPIAAVHQDKQRWCHFSVRVERSRRHKQTKENATLGFEDEKFAYVAFSKTPVTRPASRLIGRPRGTKVVNVEVCDVDGAQKLLTVSKSSPLYKPVRHADWGDALSGEDVNA